LSSSRFCRTCSTQVSALSQAPTAAATPTPAAAAPTAAPMRAPLARLTASRRIYAWDVLAGQYHIIGLICRGGMGGFYRADDLKLGQPVVLQFLPEALAEDAVRGERLFGCDLRTMAPANGAWLGAIRLAMYQFRIECNRMASRSAPHSDLRGHQIHRSRRI
jgi:hypothetical protein